jgi:hypothetical protein
MILGDSDLTLTKYACKSGNIKGRVTSLKEGPRNLPFLRDFGSCLGPLGLGFLLPTRESHWELRSAKREARLRNDEVGKETK